MRTAPALKTKLSPRVIAKRLRFGTMWRLRQSLRKNGTTVSRTDRSAITASSIPTLRRNEPIVIIQGRTRERALEVRAYCRGTPRYATRRGSRFTRSATTDPLRVSMCTMATTMSGTAASRMTMALSPLRRRISALTA